ncbi:MAG: hypothetical protein JSV49_10335 [Thermoplasmata archaeon]|nr:MAG: hypothetical protein JSV49_10335 [Thermoplasmata archaeon]
MASGSQTGGSDIGSGGNSGFQKPPGQRQQERMVMQDRLAKGFVMFTLACLVLLAGFVGYMRYDEYVEPNMPYFVCCIPSVIIAIVLIFFGFATRWTVVRRSSYRPTQPLAPDFTKTSGPSRSDTPGDSTARGDLPRRSTDAGGKPKKGGGAKKIHRRELAPSGISYTEPEYRSSKEVTPGEIAHKREQVQEFIDSLDEQYKDGLLMDETYQGLKNKHQRELLELEKQERMMAERKKRKD